jgi:phage terminase large subunit-like protein
MYSLKEELIRYSKNVISENIIGCQKHKWACMRFLHDLEREGTDKFPYVFNEEKAIRYLDWMRLFKHRKGVLRGKNIEPDIIQVFIFSNIYGWYHRDTGYRRFKKAYWQVGRKNAKSQSLACVGSYELGAFNGSMNEVYCAATKTEQARIVWEETDSNIKACPELRNKFKTSYGKIVHIKTGSFMRALSKEDRHTGDGLNPQCGIVDEYHAHDTSEIYDIIDSGMGARPEPLLIIITTAGFDLMNPCYSVEYQKVIVPLLDPDNPFEAEYYFAMVNELDKGDDYTDESNWIKANPILCSYPEGIQYIRERLALAQQAPEKMRDFITKNMNVWIQQRDSGYILMDKWAECRTNEFPDIDGLEVIGGLDLSSTIDLTSVSFEIRMPDGKIGVLSHSFMPEDTLERRRHEDKVPFDLWVNQEWITATPGAVVDYQYVLDYIDKQYIENHWDKGEICYDRALASWLRQQLEEREYIPVDTPQGRFTLSAPTKDFRGQVYNTNVIHNNNPVLGWAMGNAVVTPDNNDNIMLDKGKSRERIDPAAALMNAHVRYMVKEDVPVYETRGLRSLAD